MSRRRPTLSDVAAAAGVSKAAVSRTVNDAPGMSPQTRDHVRRVIERLGWRPDPVARALVKRQISPHWRCVFPTTSRVRRSPASTDG